MGEVSRVMVGVEGVAWEVVEGWLGEVAVWKNKADREWSGRSGDDGRLGWESGVLSGRWTRRSPRDLSPAGW